MAQFHQRLQFGPVQNIMRRRCAADDDVDGRKFSGPILKMNGAPVQFPGQRHGPVMGTIGDNDAAGAAAQQRPRRFFARLPRADDHDLMLVQRTENLLRQFHRDRSDGHAAALDVGFRPNLLGHVERFLEGLVQMAAGLLVLQGGVVGLLQLAENFRFAHHHRIQSAGDFEQMFQACRIAMKNRFRPGPVRGNCDGQAGTAAGPAGLAVRPARSPRKFPPGCRWKE